MRRLMARGRWRARLREIFEQRQLDQAVTRDVRFRATVAAQKERGASEKTNAVESRNGTRMQQLNPNRETPCARSAVLVGNSAERNAEIDSGTEQSNNAAMAKPETVRRIKSYSAASGYVYQYQFQDAHPAQRDAAHGNEFVYYVSADRKTMFPIRIFVLQEALEKWTKQTGRALTGTEEYAIAKMRLFQALDDVADFATSRPELTVDESNIQTLIDRLDL
jgi:hypothetical protein